MKRYQARKALSFVIPFVCIAAVILIARPFFNRAYYPKIENYRQFFEENEQELTPHGNAFLHQANIKSVTRFRTPWDIGYGIYAKGDRQNGYGAYMSFNVPHNETEFWDQADVEAIKGDPAASDEETMGDFFEKYGITQEEFLKWMAFLAKYDFLSITLSKDGKEVLLNVTPVSETGFAYQEDAVFCLEDNSKYCAVLNEHWAYYDGDGGLNGEASGAQ